jgi:hypothetical protein
MTGTSNDGKDNALEKEDKDNDEQDVKRDSNSADVNGIVKHNPVTGKVIDDNVVYFYRVTDRSGGVTYHVVYDTGEEKKVRASTLSFLSYFFYLRIQKEY